MDVTPGVSLGLEPTGALSAGLPMYDLAELQAANDALWTAIRRGLERRGLTQAPVALTRTSDLYGLWSDPNLLLAQTCGYPFATRLASHVRLVMTPQYRAPGCEGPYHRAAVLVRRGSPAQNLGDLRDARLALNAPDSNTGMNLLRADVAQIAQGRPWFGAVLMTGSHARSATAVAEEQADLASIDCVSWALLKRLRPQLASSLRVLLWTSRCPGLPLITSVHTDAAALAALREVLAELPGDADARAALRDLLLVRFHPLTKAHYASQMYFEQFARNLGYPRLA